MADRFEELTIESSQAANSAALSGLGPTAEPSEISPAESTGPATMPGKKTVYFHDIVDGGHLSVRMAFTDDLKQIFDLKTLLKDVEARTHTEWKNRPSLRYDKSTRTSALQNQIEDAVLEWSGDTKDVKVKRIQRPKITSLPSTKELWKSWISTCRGNGAAYEE